MLFVTRARRFFFFRPAGFRSSDLVSYASSGAAPLRYGVKCSQPSSPGSGGRTACLRSERRCSCCPLCKVPRSYAPTVQSSSLRSAILCAVFLQNTTSTSHHHTIRHNVARHSHSPHDINHRHRLHASIVPSLPVPFNELPSQRHHTHQPRVSRPPAQ